MTLKQVKTPWIDHLGDVPAHLDYFEGSMYEAVEKIANGLQIKIKLLFEEE